MNEETERRREAGSCEFSGPGTAQQAHSKYPLDLLCVEK